MRKNSAWRPDGWLTPVAIALRKLKSGHWYSFESGYEGDAHFLTPNEKLIYEAGVGALLEKLREQAYARQTIKNGALQYIGHPDSNSEEKSGCFVFIPDDAEGG